MYDTGLVTGPDSTLTVATGGARSTVDLYSRQGLALVASLWLKLSAEFRLMYQLTWLGLPIIQLPGDILMMQELVWKLRPDLVIECGLAHGGSAVFYASILELLGKGEVIAVDVEIRDPNRAAIESHPLGRRVRLVEGASTDPATVAALLVVLDSNHSAAHVRAELDCYHDLVTPNGYLVVMDGAQAHVWDTPRGKPAWRDDHPLAAIDGFLAAHPEFVIDPRYNRLHVTSSPRGFLRRRARHELAREFERAEVLA
jgi:cephalosporin hydroxylase